MDLSKESVCRIRHSTTDDPCTWLTDLEYDPYQRDKSIEWPPHNQAWLSDQRLLLREY